MTWAEVCNDRHLRDLPFKIELNRFGKIELSPTRNLHGFYASSITRLLKEILPRGESLVKCAIDTQDGTRVADAAWASAERFARIKNEFSSSIAPEICVEVLSPSNPPSEIAAKRTLYLAAGALEYWTCDIAFFDAKGTSESSRLCPTFPKSIS